jgi:O-acetylhomoserine (thiol)-lyase
MPFETRNFETLTLHGGSYRSDPAIDAVAVPIYQTTSYQFQDTGHALQLFALEVIGQVYTRIKNPTQERLAVLNGGVDALALSAGQAASDDILADLAQAPAKTDAREGVRKAA